MYSFCHANTTIPKWTLSLILEPLSYAFSFPSSSGLYSCPYAPEATLHCLASPYNNQLNNPYFFPFPAMIFRNNSDMYESAIDTQRQRIEAQARIITKLREQLATLKDTRDLPNKADCLLEQLATLIQPNPEACTCDGLRATNERFYDCIQRQKKTIKAQDEQIKDLQKNNASLQRCRIIQSKQIEDLESASRVAIQTLKASL